MTKKNKILITGGSSLLALNWAIACQKNWETVLCIHKRKINPTFARTIVPPSYTEECLSSILSKEVPDLVVNTAAITSIEQCEADSLNTQAVNVDLAAIIANTCNKKSIPFVQLSTDHLYSGTFPYASEESPLYPINKYADSKAKAEKLVTNACPNALIVRTNFYGWGTSYRHSFSDQIFTAINAGQTFDAFNDVFFTPILIADLAETIIELVMLGKKGIFNIVSDNRLSKYEFAVTLADIFGFSSSLINPISIHDRIGLVRRPSDMSLSNQKICTLLKRKLGVVSRGLGRLHDQSNQAFYQELKKL